MLFEGKHQVESGRTCGKLVSQVTSITAELLILHTEKKRDLEIMGLLEKLREQQSSLQQLLADKVHEHATWKRTRGKIVDLAMNKFGGCP